jgi:NitT/TauT family transport system ATP-binding protein
VSPELHARLAAHGDGHLSDPSVSAKALARVVAENRANGAAPLTFGMTFPFSNHNYQLRFWMAAGGVDPDEDLHLVVLPPPYMVDSMARGHVDGFCVGAPWSQVAVDQGIGRVLHFGCDLQARLTEKVLAVRAPWIARSPEILRRLLRTLERAIAFVDDLGNLDEVAAILTRPGRIEVAPDMIRRTLEGRLIVGPAHTERTNDRYLMIGRAGAARPDPVHAAWIYAQMVRWRQAPLSDQLREQAEAVFRPDLYDAALGRRPESMDGGEPADHVGAFAGPPFDPRDIEGYVKTCNSPRQVSHVDRV